jgi:putative ABC transport system ATP-binding protein
VLLITHDAQTAAYADREVTLRDGVVVSEADAGAGTGTGTELEVSP